MDLVHRPRMDPKFTQGDMDLYGLSWLKTIRNLGTSWIHWTPGQTVELDRRTENIPNMLENKKKSLFLPL